MQDQNPQLRRARSLVVERVAASLTSIARVMVAAIVSVAGLAAIAEPAGAATYSGPLVAPEIERDVASLMNQMRIDQGLAPLDLVVTTDGSADPRLETWRNCLLELNMTSLIERSSLTHDDARVCGAKNTSVIPGEQILAASWQSGSRGANPSRTATSWLSSAPHTKWLMSPNAESMMVYAACFEASGASYLIIGATLLDGSGNWPRQNTSAAAPSTAGDIYDSAYYYSCPAPGSGALVQPSKARPGTTSTPLPGTVAAARSLSEVLSASDYSASDAATLRLYRAFFGRDPDASGAAYWITQARNGVALDTLAWSFANSDEFIGRYGRVDDARFLSLMFENMLGRAPDAAGYSYWLDQMVAQGLGQHEVVRWVTANNEFANRYPFMPTS